jgi:hypothetical protein
MNISSISGTSGTYARKPAAPTPPPGGNVENRQPPPEPSRPTNTEDSSLVTILSKSRIDLYV